MTLSPIMPIFILLIGLSLPAFAASSRSEAALPANYSGRYQDDFAQQAERVRLLVRQAQLEISARLGLLQYREGFQYPLTIEFQDDTPPGMEFALAYVQLGHFGDSFAQRLVVNLEQMHNTTANIDQVFYHEMTHAVINDAVGGEASMRIPRWVQEGLAQYVSGEGMDRVKALMKNVPREHAAEMLCDIDAGIPSGRCYPQYYLAIKYLEDKGTVNAVQALVRELIAGKPIEEAISQAIGVPYDRYKSDLQTYSKEVYADNGVHNPYSSFPGN